MENNIFLDSNGDNIYFMTDHIYNTYNYLANKKILIPGWSIDNSDIEVIPIYFEYENKRMELIRKNITIQKLVDDFNKIIDKRMIKFIGLKELKDKHDLYFMLYKLLEDELEDEISINFFIKDKNNKEIVGILELYDYDRKWKKAKLSIGIREDYNGKGIGRKVLESVKNIFVNKELKGGILTRLGLVVEHDNIKIIEALERENHGFIKEGYLKNYYGIGYDCYVYAYTI